MSKKEKAKKVKKTQDEAHAQTFPPRLIGVLADEVAKTVIRRLPSVLPRRRKRKKKKSKKIENAIFLDTSAIIDGRIFDVISLGLFSGTFVALESILLELKHIADSKDLVKRERGRKGLEFLEKIKKAKGVKFVVLTDDEGDFVKNKKLSEVDERLIYAARVNKGKIITCDYNLEKKANVTGITAINVNTLASMVKIRAVPGEALHIKILHVGKDKTQGVGYLDDGTMIVVEEGNPYLGREVDVIVSRVIQTKAGRIFFAKRI